MGFEKSHLFGKVQVDVSATGTATLAFSTDVPGGALVQDFVFTIPITTRTIIRSRLPGAMQGHIVQATCTPSAGAQVQLYGVRLWTRELPDGEWGWWDMPIEATPVLYQAMPLPVESTPAVYQSVPLPVEATSESFSPMGLPIEETPALYQGMPLPVEATGVEYARLALPVEATPESYGSVQVPVEGTPMSYEGMALPVKPTPPVPQWISVPVDE